ncbi:MAG: bifunctional histidinol-phosphatase/imidazoleglycerol-phosphate dehydratase HisB [Bacteroidales bacterium]|nr:bifunctional histidinol-phosphatase/imidazoleglycerol-phosphate dehydratase HisB [Bacteroidales bacterium]
MTTLKKAIFVDRDGTILVEPADEQIDSFEKFAFVPGAISGLKAISGLGFELVLVSNQDGLGTPSFPTETFQPCQDLMLKTLAGEGVVFDNILIDKTFPADNAPTRKPGTGMLGAYMDGSYDLAGSFVIGDRETDAQLAANLGAKALLLGPVDWAEIAETVRSSSRQVTIERKTRETDISLTLDLDGKGPSGISTGLNFFDHMLEQLPHHGGISLALSCKGDLEVDEHHTMEDVGIVLGEAINQALGDKRGTERYGFVLPMDECKALVLIDFGGRADFVWKVEFTREYVGDTPTEMFSHFFKSLCIAARCNLRIEAEGENNHHLAEAIFKAFARALRQAVRRNVFDGSLPSSKGTL